MNGKPFKPSKAVVHLLGVVVTAAVFLSIFGKVSEKTGVSSIDGGIVLTDPSGNTCEIIYSDVTELSLINLPESYGVCMDGARKKGYCYGLWEREEWGPYFLCVKENTKKAIWIRQGDEILVFNYEGEKPTESFYEALQKKCGK